MRKADEKDRTRKTIKMCSQARTCHIDERASCHRQDEDQRGRAQRANERGPKTPSPFPDDIRWGRWHRLNRDDSIHTMKKLETMLAVTATLLTLALAVEIGRLRWALRGAVKVPAPTVLSDASRPAAGP